MKVWEDVETHKKEYLEYLKMDVLSFRQVYIEFSKAIFEMYSLYVGKFMTITQLAYAAFTTTIKNGFYLQRTPKKDENAMRKMYRGGRVLCGRKEWRSKYWQEIEDNRDGTQISDELYEKINDFLDYIDCNSLYPTAQVDREYPVGTYTRKKITSECLEHTILMDEINNIPKHAEKKWRLMGAKVDVECPKYINIAFLMTRNEKTGAVEQNLFDKKKEWYTGPELWEASILGYKITRIYEYIQR
jgi:hypothetical protein